MKPYFIKTPNWIRKIYANLTWSFITSKKEIYLTFDDGPTPEITEWTLNILQKFKAKATFFCIGKNIKNHPDIFAKIVEQGHSIGNHTYNHVNGWKTTTDTYLDNTHKAELEIDSQFQNLYIPKPTLLFRPPYGKIKRKDIRRILKKGYKIIMWDVLSADFDASITQEKCLENVLNHGSNGSIVIFHDSLKAEKNMKFALPKVLEYYQDKGYLFKAIK